MIFDRQVLFPIDFAEADGCLVWVDLNDPPRTYFSEVKRKISKEELKAIQMHYFENEIKEKHVHLAQFYMGNKNARKSNPN